LTPEQQKAMDFLTEFSKQMVVTAFPGDKNFTRASSLIKEIYQICDELIAGCLKNGAKPSCKKGCYWCCFMRVKVTPLEVLCIIDYLQSSLTPGELSALRQRLVETDEITRGMDGHQRVRAKKICPLVVDDECLVYPVRPITCRTYHSLNSSDCKLSLDDEEHHIKIRQDISVIDLGLSTGLIEGLRTVGLQTRLLELIEGLRIAMDEPECSVNMNLMDEK
jgi:hypothetical protein